MTRRELATVGETWHNNSAQRCAGGNDTMNDTESGEHWRLATGCAAPRQANDEFMRLHDEVARLRKEVATAHAKGFEQAREQAAKVCDAVARTYVVLSRPSIAAGECAVIIRAMTPEGQQERDEAKEPAFCAMCGHEDFNHSRQYGGCIVTTNTPEHGDRCPCHEFCHATSARPEGER